ncbi:transposase [Deinococcus sp.]|uniref:transposase n=1 Tax=Deinococcus sp. TaxID=47478 RepID=UPI003C7CF681
MSRPELSLLPVLEALQVLQVWLIPKMPPRVQHRNEKASDGELVAIAILQRVHRQPYFSGWWALIKRNFCFQLPSLTQATVRLQRLLPVIEMLCVEVFDLDFVLVDSQPLPVCRSKRAARCKVRKATMGFGTQGSVYGLKLHAWSTLNGKLVQSLIRPSHEHDLVAGYRLNRRWVKYGAPKQIGDKAYLDGVYLTPPKTNTKTNTKTLDPRWKKEYGTARKMIETVFSSLTRRGIRFGQIKTLASLRLKVALTVFPYNWRFF